MELTSLCCGSLTLFRLSSPLEDVFAHQSWQRANEAALEALSRGQRVLVIGHPGTGKTLLLRNLGQILREQGAETRELRPGDALEEVAVGQVLLIDEAGMFGADELDRIWRLSNVCVVAGLPNLPDLLPSTPRTVSRIAIEPIGPEDVARFVLSRMAANGRPLDFFTPEALVALAQHSAGLFRVVIILAGAAMFFAEQRGAEKVTAADVAEAVSMRAAVAAEAQAAPLAEDERSVEEVVATTPAAAAALPPEPVALRPRRRAAAIAGLTAWACASLATVVAAAVVARHVSQVPSRMAQDLQDRSPPMLATAAAPPPAQEPVIPAAMLAPAQVAASLPPQPVAATRPLLPERSVPPEPVRTAAAVRFAQIPTPPSQPPAPEQVGQVGPAIPVAVSSAAPVLAAASPARVADARPLLPALSASSQRVGTAPALLFAQMPTLSQRPAPEDVRPPQPALAFNGPIMNDTMGQGGQLSLQLSFISANGTIGAFFHASHGLIGSGVLKGTMAPGGRVLLSGRLMMGRNPFDCDLTARIQGNSLVGEATFVRRATGSRAHSSFSLERL